MMKVEIKKVKLSTIKLNPDNPRKIAGPDMDRLVKSLTDFPEMMELREIVVDDNMTILGGNMRYQALKKIKAKDCLAKVVKGLTDAQKREFVIKDNSNFGAYDWDILKSDWDDLPLDDWGVELPDDWLKEPDAPKDAEPQIDKAAELNKIWKVKAGDLYQIGEHRLLCGDSTKAEDVARVMGGEKADVVFTDPPYGMNLDANYADIYKNSIAKVRNQKKVIGDEKEFDPSFWLSLFKATDEQFWWGCDYYQNKLPNTGSIFVWDKVCESMDGRIGNEFELCWSKQKHKKEIIHIKWAGFLGLKAEDGKREHPTQKPVRLVNHFLESFSGENNLIADPFLGSGTTMVACQNLNRKCRGLELDPLYCAVILQRMTDAFPDIEIKKIER